MKKNQVLACLIMIGILFANSMPVFAVEEGFQEEAVLDSTEQNNQEESGGTITGFLGLEENYYEWDEKGTLEEAISKLPKELQVELDGVKEIAIPVTWVCSEDYEGTECDSYEFVPDWDKGMYPLADSLNAYWDVPSIEVLVPMAVSEEEQNYIDTAREELKKILKEDVYALVYLCEEYELKSKPSVQSGTISTLNTGSTVKILDFQIASNRKVWYLVSFETNNQIYEGYIERNYLAYSNEAFLKWEAEYLSIYMMEAVLYSTSYQDVELFPESYQNQLMQLKTAHPNWIFVKYNTGLDWNTVIKNETVKDRNLISASMEDAYKGEFYGAGWYQASENAVKYYMDPRNFLDDIYIFQFEQLTYNPSYHTKDAVQSILDSTFMSGCLADNNMTYAQTFFKIGAELGVSPFHLASRVYQEQGQGTSSLISGTYSGYEGYYNYFNIGASGRTNKEVYENGLTYAKEKGWSSIYNSLRGGAEILSANYILKGQDTLYLQKFDVDISFNGLYVHQYMQNVRAPYTESVKVRAAYTKTGALDNPFVFKIPVYNNMPAAACRIPTAIPTVKPTEAPTQAPTETPTVKPTAKPTQVPTQKPTAGPTENPTAEPTPVPTKKPTEKPTEAPAQVPTEKPTVKPTVEPTETPTAEPTPVPTKKPTAKPTVEPTEAPTAEPTPVPTKKPTEKPTEAPTQAPTEAPAVKPTAKPTQAPTRVPTEKPTEKPTAEPTEAPTVEPTQAPTEKPVSKPTVAPMQAPIEKLPAKPTQAPTQVPTEKPTERPTAEPTETPTEKPVAEPTEAPTEAPAQDADNSMVVKIEKQPEETIETSPPTPSTVNSQSSESGKKSTDTGKKGESTPIPDNSGKKEVTIDINESGIVYSETLEKMKEEEIKAVFKAGENVTWTIDGNSIDADALADVNLEVRTEGGGIPDEKIQELVTDGSNYLELSLSHEGEFGFKAVLTVKMEEGNPGQYANLFYYNENEVWEYIGASMIDESKNASFEFEHASEYLIVINDKIMDSVLAEKVNTAGEEISKQTDDAETVMENEVSRGEISKKVLILILILLGSIFIVIGTVLIVNKKSN